MQWCGGAVVWCGGAECSAAVRCGVMQICNVAHQLSNRLRCVGLIFLIRFTELYYPIFALEQHQHCLEAPASRAEPMVMVMVMVMVPVSNEGDDCTHCHCLFKK